MIPSNKIVEGENIKHQYPLFWGTWRSAFISWLQKGDQPDGLRKRKLSEKCKTWGQIMVSDMVSYSKEEDKVRVKQSVRLADLKSESKT